MENMENSQYNLEQLDIARNNPCYKLSESLKMDNFTKKQKNEVLRLIEILDDVGPKARIAIFNRLIVILSEIH